MAALHNIFAEYVMRPNFNNGISHFAIWNIIPIILLPLICIGVVRLWKEKKMHLLAAIITIAGFWIAYTYTEKFFIIEYSRLVAIGSVLLVIVSGFGSEYLIRFLKRPSQVKALEKIFLILIFIWSFSYTSHTAWEKLTLTLDREHGSHTEIPAAPANQYITGDDLRLFSGFSQQRFIAPAWKGLVIGAATDNSPLESKQSVISNDILSYYTFITADCAGKKSLAEKSKLVYAYSTHFECPDFIPLGKSSEGLYLYRFFRE